MLVLYGLAYLYDSLFKRNVTGNFPSHERNHHPKMAQKPMKQRSRPKRCVDTRKTEKKL